MVFFKDDFKTIAVFTFPSEYTVLQHLLDQANLRFVFQNEFAVSILPFQSNAFGGIKLKVHLDDIVKAKHILYSI